MRQICAARLHRILGQDIDLVVDIFRGAGCNSWKIIMKLKILGPLLAVTLAVSACDMALSADRLWKPESATDTSAGEVDPASGGGTDFKQRVADLEIIRVALEAYRDDNGGYPDTGDMWASLGHRKASNWLPELAPNYLKTVPQDPSGSWDPGAAQYLYKSNGLGYKLVSHKSGDCTEVTAETSAQRDPKRSNAGSCWAYGFWTPDYAEK